VLAVMEGRATDRTPFMPITMLFASRRAGVLYRDYAADYRVLAEAQLRVAEDFSIDHVSTISDPAREAADFGAAVEWFEDQPPAINEAATVLQDKGTLAQLKAPDPLGGGRMHDRVRGIALLRERVGNDKAVEGWVEGPCAEAADLRGINTLMTDFMDDPEFVRDLFAFCVDNALRFARPQVEAGADFIGVGDAAASLVGPAIYKEFVLPFEHKLVDGLHALGTRVRLHICGKTRRLYEGMGQLGCDIVDLDWMNPVDEARAKMGPRQVLLGNIDPVKVLRAGTPETVHAAMLECSRQSGGAFVAGAGCEVVWDTPAGNLHAMRIP
jgi:MtaA/CmuA family methyltransferase